MFNRQRQVEWLGSFFDRPPIIVSPYDAELFGHWWFEGPQWIDFLLRKIACDQDDIKTITPAEYLDRFGDLQTVQPPECSWGAGGFHEVWLNGSNEWVYPLLHAAAERMSALVQRFPDASGLPRWALDQAARELLLAQSSDWAFIMKTGTSVDYAVKRFKTHLHRFNRLAEMAESGGYDENYLREVTARDSLFRTWTTGFSRTGRSPRAPDARLLPGGHRHRSPESDLRVHHHARRDVGDIRQHVALVAERRQKRALREPGNNLRRDAAGDVDAADGAGAEREVAGLGAVDADEQIERLIRERVVVFQRRMGDDRCRVAGYDCLGQGPRFGRRAADAQERVQPRQAGTGEDEFIGSATALAQ